MKCPYRKKVIHKNTSDDEEFMECYGQSCPYYGINKYPNGDLEELCIKVEGEYSHPIGGK